METTMAYWGHEALQLGLRLGNLGFEFRMWGIRFRFSVEGFKVDRASQCRSEGLRTNTEAQSAQGRILSIQGPG